MEHAHKSWREKHKKKVTENVNVQAEKDTSVWLHRYKVG